jgi:NAD(P)-dependent dehydrogenase (short-subunit alcohol dehydrogenase family)
MQFDGAHVLVTGGTSGLGAAIAKAFVENGAQVTITGTRSGAKDYDEDLTAYTYRQLDIENTDSIDKLAGDIPRLDILINNGGISLASLGLSEWEPDIFDRAVRMHLTGVYRLSAALVGKLEKSTRKGGAAIVGIGSMSSIFGVEVVPGYGAAKTGLIGLTRVMAVAWGRRNIRANAVAVSFIPTRMSAKAAEDSKFTAPKIARTPLGRLGTPEDVAGPVLFLAGPAAAFVTGQYFAIDGGYSIKGD